MATEYLSSVTLAEPSLPEVHASVSVSRSPFYWRRLVGFLGPGFLISVGYMDPGNWATDIAGGGSGMGALDCEAGRTKLLETS